MTVDLSMIGLQGQQAFAERMNTLASASLNQANAQAQQLENTENARIQSLNDEVTRKVNEITGTGTVANPADPAAMAAHMQSLADPVRAAADVYLKGGAVGRGMELLKQASEIEAKESNIQKDQYDIQQTKLENLLKGTQIVGQELGTAQNESEWRLGLKNIRKDVESGLFVMEPQLLEQLESMPYDPNVAAYFSSKAISMADNARIELQKIDDERQAEVARVQAAQGAARIAVSQATLEETARHHAVIEKAAGEKGTTTVGPPNEAAMKSVVANLQNTVFKGMDIKKDDPTLLAAADYISSDATRMIRENRGLDWNTAVNRSIITAQRTGALGIAPGREHKWYERGDKDPDQPKFDNQGTTPETAPRPPVDSNGKILIKSMIKGRYYLMANGQVGKFTGTGMEPVE